MLLVNDAACTVVSHAEACGVRFYSIINPVYAQKVGLRILVAVIQSCFRTQGIRNHQRLNKRYAVSIRMTFDVEVFQLAVGNVYAVGAVR